MEFKTLVKGMLNVLSENLIRIKKIQSEPTDTLIAIKKNSQAINSRMDEAENQTSDLEYKEAKTNQSEH